MAKRENCRCEEVRIYPDFAFTDLHDCDYVSARNKLMVDAAALANIACESAAQNPKWAKEFHRAMNQLAYEAGLTMSPPRPEGVEFVVPVKLKQLKLKKFGI